jgi:hypothetical protein
MAEQVFAVWVEPVALTLSEDRRQVIMFARSAPIEMWERPSGVSGWTCREVLAHLAGGNDQMLQAILRAAVAREAPDAAVFTPDTDAENARRVAERQRWTIEQLIAELERDGTEVQALLSQLTEEDQDLRWPGFSLTLGEFLRIVQDEHHDLHHLEEMRASS